MPCFIIGYNYIQITDKSIYDIWIPFFTGFLHITFCYFLTNSFDPGKLYNIQKTKYNDCHVFIGYLLIYIIHFIGFLII